MSSRLPPLPDRFEATVSALHRVAEEVVAPARKPDNEIALEPTPGGFGTPPFEWQGATHQVRVEGAELVRAVDGQEQERTALEGVDAEAAAALAGWYAFGAVVLDRLAAAPPADDVSPADAAPTAATGSDDVSPAVLWPEHFDLAIELGSEADGHRATYGFSPGDEQHRQPYAYVGPWVAQPAGGLWNASGFGGAELGYAELLTAPDPAAAALEFFIACRDALAKNPPTEETK